MSNTKFFSEMDFFPVSSSVTIKTVNTCKNICTKIAQSNLFSCFLTPNYCKHFLRNLCGKTLVESNRCGFWWVFFPHQYQRIIPLVKGSLSVMWGQEMFFFISAGCSDLGGSYLWLPNTKILFKTHDSKAEGEDLQERTWFWHAESDEANEIN